VDADDVCDGSEVKCIGCGLWHVVTEYMDGSFGLSPFGDEDEDAATDPAGPVDMQRMQDEIAEAAGCVRSVEPGPWRGAEHTVERSDTGNSWTVDLADNGCVAWFIGPDAEARAREYAALMSASTPFFDMPAPSRLLGTPTHPKPCGTFRALSVGSAYCGDCGWHVGAHASGKPAAVALWQRWACVGIDGELEVVSVDPYDGAPDVFLATPGSAPVVVRARAADMLGLKEWRFLD
jgi:hypothetical protein